MKIKLSIPPMLKVFLVVVCAVFLFSMIFFVPVISDFREYVAAGKHMKAREFSFAYDKYRMLLEEYSFSVPLILKTADAAMSAQYIGYLAEVVDNYIMDKNLSDNEYYDVMEYVDFLDRYFGTYYDVDDILYELGETFSEDDDPDLVGQFLRDRLKELLLSDDSDKTYIYYLLASMAEDAEIALEYFRLSTQQDARCTYTYAHYGNVLRRAGDFNEARQVYMKALELNACDALSWRGLGVLDMLEGQKSLGLESIRLAYEIEPYGLYVPEALIIALIENGMRDEAMEFIDMIVSEGFQFDEDILDYLDGAVSMEHYYMG